jgi:hypothetical protein
MFISFIVFTVFPIKTLELNTSINVWTREKGIVQVKTYKIQVELAVCLI